MQFLWFINNVASNISDAMAIECGSREEALVGVYDIHTTKHPERVKSLFGTAS